MRSVFFWLSLLAISASAWVSPSTPSTKDATTSVGRRELLGSMAIVGATLLSGVQPSAAAAAQVDIDKANIAKGKNIDVISSAQSHESAD